MDWGLFLGCIDEFRNMQMTEKGGNKLNGNYDIDIKKGKKGGFSGVYGTHRSDIFVTIFFSHQYVCADTILIIYYDVTLVTAPAHRPYSCNLNFTSHAPSRCTFDFQCPNCVLENVFKCLREPRKSLCMRPLRALQTYKIRIV